MAKENADLERSSSSDKSGSLRDGTGRALEGQFEYLGRMNDPTASAYIKGPCGDEMEFYLIIERDTITDVKFYTDGCSYTRECGQAAAEMAIGKGIYDALDISPRKIMDRLGSLPPDHKHCSILAASTLQKAIADHFLKK